MWKKILMKVMNIITITMNTVTVDSLRALPRQDGQRPPAPLRSRIVSFFYYSMKPWKEKALFPNEL